MLAGRFTKAVAIEMVQGKILGVVTVPTTHFSSDGVSTGIVEALKKGVDRKILNPEL